MATLKAISKAINQANSKNTTQAKVKGKGKPYAQETILLRGAKNRSEEMDRSHRAITFGTLSFVIAFKNNGNYSSTVQTLSWPKEPNGNRTTDTNHHHTPLHQLTQRTQDPRHTSTNDRYITRPVLTTTQQTQKTQRFVKPSPASSEWQLALKKNKNRKKENNVKPKKRCYFCHKLGHLQRNCWRKIQCFNYGRNGHKYAHCLFKEPKDT